MSVCLSVCAGYHVFVFLETTPIVGGSFAVRLMESLCSRIATLCWFAGHNSSSCHNTRVRALAQRLRDVSSLTPCRIGFPTVYCSD